MYPETFIVRLATGTRDRIAKLAALWHVSPSEIGRRAIREYLNKHGPEADSTQDSPDVVESG